MSRGKNQRGKAARTRRALREEIAALEAAKADESHRAAEAAQRAQHVDAARARLAREHEATRHRLAETIESASRRAAGAMRTREFLAAARREVRSAETELDQAVDADQTIDEAVQAGLPVVLNDVHRSASQEYRQVWFRKHSGQQLLPNRNLSLRGWVPEYLEHDTDQHARFACSTALDQNPEACWSWAIPPWMRHPGDTTDAPRLRAEFGATTTGAPRLPDADYPGRERRSDAVFTVPWRHTPLIEHPADALDLAYWYQRSMWSQGWWPDTEPVPMWLPEEHSSAFPAARPLHADVDVRLPFPTVFTALSSPWRIEPNREQNHRLLIHAHPLLLHARGRLARRNAPDNLQDTLARLQATGLTDRADLPSPLETLDAFGGYVEGLVLTAHPDGTPADDIAWCVAIYHPFGLPLARIAIPAALSQAEWHTPVANVITGVALSCWHAAATLPPRATYGRGNQRSPDTTAATADGLHILDIEETSPQPREPAQQSSSNTRQPHFRRGHWRRQAVGAGRAGRRWTWVRTTTVHGAHRTKNAVYVLRE